MKYVITTRLYGRETLNIRGLNGDCLKVNMPVYRVRLESIEDAKIWAKFIAHDAGYYYTYVEQPPKTYKDIFNITHTKYFKSEKVKVTFDELPWTFEEKGEDTTYKYVIDMKNLLEKCKKEELKVLDVLGD